MMVSDDAIDSFSRNLQLEKKIDRKNAFYGIKFESLSLFLDLLDELIVDSNENKDRDSKGKMRDFLRRRHLRLEDKKYNIKEYNNEEIDYINRFREYISNIRSIIVGKSLSASELIKCIINVIKKSALECENDSESLIKAKLKNIEGLSYSINNNSGSINIYLSEYNYCISLIYNSNFELPNHRWLTSLVVIRNVSDVFSKVKKSNNLDYITYDLLAKSHPKLT